MTEAELCAAFLASVAKGGKWTAYAETAGFDILLVRIADGVQVGIEAKLTLNPRVVAQVLTDRHTWSFGLHGPDYRAVLVPAGKCGPDLVAICGALGITVISQRDYPGSTFYGSWGRGPAFAPDLPEPTFDPSHWQEWAPLTRCELPDYVPDVQAGASAPVALTPWKVKAIKLSVLLDERPVTRADFKHLLLSPTNWTGPGGWLERTEAGWIRGNRTPDLKAQHPRNYGEIAADRERWAPKVAPVLREGQEPLL